MEKAKANGTVMVVEDEKPLLEAIRDKLGQAGFEVVTARNVDQALGYLHDLKGITAIWLDHYLLGQETGLDFLAQLKKHGTWQDIPVFVVSNTAGPDKKQSYLALGATRYFIKAENRLDTIVDDIRSWLEDRTGKNSGEG